MALAHLPNIVTSGLVFYYDMNNTQKSWKGAPTTNLITNPLPNGTASDFANAGGVGTLTYDSPTQAIKWVKTAYEAWGAYLYFNPVFNGDLSITDSYTISFEWKTENTAIADSVYGYNLVQGNGASAAAAANILSNSVLQENGWYLFKYTFIPANTGITAYNRIILGPQSTNISTFYIRKIQFEKLNFASPFVNGIRASTRAILDLMNNNTITASSLTYASDGTFSFNGTSNYLDAGNSTAVQLPTAITMEAWVNPAALTGSGNIMSKNSNSGYRFRIENNNQLWFYVSGNVILGGYVPTNTWSHLVVTGDSSGLYGYINGVLVASNSTAFAPTAPASGNLFVGCIFANAEVFNGKISVAKVYNRRLSAAEIKQNFNALRRRHGI